jgi:hypothetical protein
LQWLRMVCDSQQPPTAGYVGYGVEGVVDHGTTAAKKYCRPGRGNC